MLGVDDEPVLNHEGVHRVVLQHNACYQTTEWALYGLDGEPVFHLSRRAHLWQYDFDDRGHVAETRYLDTKRQPTSGGDYGCATERYVHDDDGDLTDMACLGPDGTAAIFKGSRFAKVSWQHRDGLPIEQTNRGVSDELVEVMASRRAVPRVGRPCLGACFESGGSTPTESRP